MEADFKIIVITPERIVENEGARIVSLLNSGVVWRVHIRHPKHAKKEIEALLDLIPSNLYCRLSVHDNYDLAEKYKGLGIHLNGRNQIADKNGESMLSKSCHSFNEVSQSNCDYVTLSPIFDSISKIGYHSSFSLDDETLHSIIKDKNVVALGGVKPQYFQKLKDAGFYGAALLGYLWHDDETEFANRIKTIKQHLCCNL